MIIDATRNKSDALAYAWNEILAYAFAYTWSDALAYARSGVASLWCRAYALWCDAFHLAPKACITNEVNHARRVHLVPIRERITPKNPIFVLIDKYGIFWYGEPLEIRTPDPFIKSEMLCQLS